MTNPARSTPDARRRGRSAFTLIELLVVISIIALLIGILLPVLGTARESARNVQCQAHLSGAGQGMFNYTAESNDWIPGPNTSGAELTIADDLTAARRGPTSPLQNTDWVSPSLGRSLGFQSDPGERLVKMFNNEFKCPTNDVQYDPTAVSTGTGFSIPVPSEGLSFSSYSAMMGFHVWKARETGDRDRGITAVDTPGTIIHQYRNGLDRSYRPRIDRVGQASEKIFAMDGARFVNNPDSVTYSDGEYADDGGNWMSYGPALTFTTSGTSLTGEPWRFQVSGGSPSVDREYEKFAYRHPNQTVNAVHFDGHVENLDLDATAQVTSEVFSKYLPPNVDLGSFYGTTY